MSKNQDTKKDQPRQDAPETEKQTYLFPNDGQPFSCEAASLEEADKANADYLKQLKENR